MIRRRPSPAAGLRAWAAAFGKPPAPPAKEKAVRPGKGETAFKNYWQPNYTAPRRARQRGEVDVVLAAWLFFAVVLLAHAAIVVLQ
jgi:hypothetical protein